MRVTLRNIGMLEADGGIVCVSPIASAKHWKGVAQDDSDNDYYRLCDFLDDNYESFNTYRSDDGTEYITFSSTSKSFALLLGKDSFCILEIEYLDDKSFFKHNSSIEVEVQNDKKLGLSNFGGKLVVFDAALDSSDIPFEQSGLLRSLGNNHFEDIAIFEVLEGRYTVHPVAYLKENTVSLIGVSFVLYSSV
ncbi:MAG: hypothetical protein AAF944_25915 [Bacteroidota bacterium]